MKTSRHLAFLHLFLACGLGGLFAAEPTEKGEKGFRFPGGEADAGREVFTSLNCTQCHKVSGVELPDPKVARRIELSLADQQRFVKNYEDLLTAITNPKHVMNQQYRELLEETETPESIEPLMPDFTKTMTVRQLMDLVAFLDEAFTKALPGYGGK